MIQPMSNYDDPGNVDEFIIVSIRSKDEVEREEKRGVSRTV